MSSASSSAACGRRAPPAGRESASAVSRRSSISPLRATAGQWMREAGRARAVGAQAVQLQLGGGALEAPGARSRPPPPRRRRPRPPPASRRARAAAPRAAAPAARPARAAGRRAPRQAAAGRGSPAPAAPAGGGRGARSGRRCRTRWRQRRAERRPARPAAAPPARRRAAAVAPAGAQHSGQGWSSSTVRGPGARVIARSRGGQRDPGRRAHGQEHQRHARDVQRRRVERRRRPRSSAAPRAAARAARVTAPGSQRRHPLQHLADDRLAVFGRPPRARAAAGGRAPGRQRLHVVGQRVVAASSAASALAARKSIRPGARARAQLDAGIGAGRVEHGDDVAAQRRRCRAPRRGAPAPRASPPPRPPAPASSTRSRSAVGGEHVRSRPREG